MLKLKRLDVSGYRSLRQVEMQVADLTVLAGQNGAGKTNLYRALQLVQAAATGSFARAIAAEGGMDSAVWAGRRKNPVRITFQVELAAPGSGGVYRYAVAAGVPTPMAAAFPLEPHVKEESLDFIHHGRARKLLQRRGPHLLAWDEEGREHEVSTSLLPSATGLSALELASTFPDQHIVRQVFTDWRFYHEMRTDQGAALRQPALAVTTPTLASDGHDLAAVFATLAHVRGDLTDVQAAIADAFPGASLDVPPPGGVASFGFVSPDFVTDGGRPRIFAPAELSDGTLRYLALVGALLAYRLPAFLALNEPETSLHPDLIRPLARLIAGAARRTQIWVVTHSQDLADALATEGAMARRVVKSRGESTILRLGDPTPAD